MGTCEKCRTEGVTISYEGMSGPWDSAGLFLKNDFVHSKRRVAFQAKLHVGMSGPWDRGIS